MTYHTTVDLRRWRWVDTGHDEGKDIPSSCIYTCSHRKHSGHIGVGDETAMQERQIREFVVREGRISLQTSEFELMIQIMR